MLQFDRKTSTAAQMKEFPPNCFRNRMWASETLMFLFSEFNIHHRAEQGTSFMLLSVPNFSETPAVNWLSLFCLTNHWRQTEHWMKNVILLSTKSCGIHLKSIFKTEYKSLLSTPLFSFLNQHNFIRVCPFLIWKYSVFWYIIGTHAFN